MYFTKTLHCRCSTGFYLNTPCSKVYFPLEKEVNGKINSHQTFYSNELKKFSDSKKSGAGLDDTCESKWAHFFEIWLVCFKLISLCKHRVWCYIFWFRKCVKLIWPCISGLKLLLRRSQNFGFLALKNLLRGQFWGALTHADIS